MCYRRVALLVLGAILLALRRKLGFVMHSALSGGSLGGTTTVKARISIKEEAALRNRTYETLAEVVFGGTGRGNDSGADKDGLELDIDLRLENDEPYASRWQRRFASSKARGKAGGYLFFRHMRKAGGTSLREYFRDAMSFHNVSREQNDWRNAKNPSEEYQIHYVEHEFQTLDWQCSQHDPRWKEAMNIIILRHPIERHLSEFFFSGPAGEFKQIDKEQLYANETYTSELSAHLKEWVPKWMRHIGTRNTAHNVGRGQRTATTVEEVKLRRDDLEGKFNMMFGRRYTDNFQLRALAGCSTRACMKEKGVKYEHRQQIKEYHPTARSYDAPVPRCTHYFRKPDAPNIIDICAKPGTTKNECLPLGCDGPCFYPSVAWGAMGPKDVERAVTALKAFDAVLLMEKFDDVDQSDFLSDVLGVPRDADFALARRGSAANKGVEKRGKREKTHFYRDLLAKLGLEESVLKLMREENEWEIELFKYAERLNEMMIEKWKEEGNSALEV
ncbi:hypothetical protein ACHAXT_002979 [Thalassiosira profunda]